MSKGAAARHLVGGRYVIGGELAAGGMAAVHYGLRLDPDGPPLAVAVKRLHARYAGNAEFLAMLADEARLTGRAAHPNVVRVFDVCTDGAELLLVLEYVHGETLARLLRVARLRGERTPPAIAAAVVRALLEALDAAHEARDTRGAALDIVHRDVSPQNVMVGADGVVRLLDFGIAKAASRRRTTRGGEVKGKPAYMAPEQHRGAPLSRRADVFAAAVVLWEALTGHRLFDGPDDQAIARKVAEKYIDPPGDVVEGVPTALDGVVLRGLARSPGDRFASAREMARALDAAIEAASSAALRAWVTDLAADALAERADAFARLERSLSPAPSSTPPTPGRSTRPCPAGALAGAATPTPGRDAPPVSRRPRATRRAAATLAAAFAVFAFDSRPGDVPPPLAPASPPDTPLRPPVLPAASVSRRPPAALGSSQRGPRTPPRCQPPYLIDPEGHRVRKPECS